MTFTTEAAEIATGWFPLDPVDRNGFSDSMLVSHKEFNWLGGASSLQNQKNQLALHESRQYESMLKNAKPILTILFMA